MEREGRLKRAAIDLAIKIVHLYDKIERKAFMKQQLGKAGTSVGANIHEADYAESPEDFIHKMKIALKECHECEFWLIVLAESCPELADEAALLRQEAGSIRRMLISSITTLQNKLKK
ncbi:MAG: four helix bundle protein [Akkermansia sp.]|nr:four helix bundle protein [Akkermansia sp.]